MNRVRRKGRRCYAPAYLTLIVRLTPAKRAEHERSVVAARGALGNEAFEAAWANVHAMPLQEVIMNTLRKDEERAVRRGVTAVAAEDGYKPSAQSPIRRSGPALEIPPPICTVPHLPTSQAHARTLNGDRG